MITSPSMMKPFAGTCSNAAPIGRKRAVQSLPRRLYTVAPLAAVNLTQIELQFLRTTVSYRTSKPPGTIVIDPQNHFLYLVQGTGLTALEHHFGPSGNCGRSSVIVNHGALLAT